MKEYGINRLTVSASVIKSIALITMFIDHFGMTVVYELEQRYIPNIGADGVITVYMRMIGRVAFILYAFLLVEGFVNTSGRKKYVLRLLAGALISEIPFDLAGSGRWFDPYDQNIFFTLTIGFCTIWVLDILRSKGKNPENHFYEVMTVAAGLVIAELIRCDYGCMGVGLIVVFYLFRWKKELFAAVLAESYFGMIVVDLIRYMIKRYRYFARLGREFQSPRTYEILVNLIEWAENRMIYSMPGILAAVLLILCYNGKKGRQLPKAFYYLFYPLHLSILYLLLKMI